MEFTQMWVEREITFKMEWWRLIQSDINRITVMQTVIIIVCLMLATSHPVLAAPPTPGSVISPIDKPVYQPETSQAPDITQEEPVEAPTAKSAFKVKVNSFQFKGNTTYSNDVLKAVVSSYEGRDLSITDIYHVADVVEIYYRSRGFLLTSVYVPAQQIDSGNIILEVIEGRLGSVKIDGEMDSYTEQFLIEQATELKPGQIIDDETLEKETLLLDDLPGLAARAVISPGDVYGTSDVIFKTREDRYSGVISVNNFGRKSIGEKRIDAGLLIANPILQGDQLNLSLIASESSRMLYGRLDYDALIDTHGSRMGFSYSGFNYEVDTSQLALPAGATLEGSGSTFIIRASHPLQRSTKTNTYLAISAKRSETSEKGTVSVRPDSAINLLEINIGWDHLYRDYSRTTISGSLITNFKSRSDLLDTDSQQGKLMIDLRHNQPFFEDWFFAGHMQVAYSPDPLVDVEKFRLGGQNSVRAFPSAELSGDKGGVILLDVGKNFIVAGDISLTPRVFIDSGKVYRIQPVGLLKSESLTGYGVGVSVLLEKYHNVDLEVSEPSTDRTSSDGRDTRFWINYRGLF